MSSITFTTSNNQIPNNLALTSAQGLSQPHIHAVDMPFRLTSTWQDFGCEFGQWWRNGQLVAWAVFQPAWWNLDYAITPELSGSPLEKEMFAWGADQMRRYSQESGETFWGSVELFADAPQLDKTKANLRALGFKQFEWSTLRFAIDLQQQLPEPEVPGEFVIRPLRGDAEVAAYVGLHRAAFGSDKMTLAWRQRTLTHPTYRPNLDLVVLNSAEIPIGFCIGWLKDGVGQIEPLGVHPDYQGLGLGRALELNALHKFKQQGAHKAIVDHVSLNESAIALSKQTGFKQTNNALRFYIEVE